MSRGRLLVALAALAAVSALGVSYYGFFVRPDRAAPPTVAPTPAPAADMATTLVISDLTTPVEIAGADGVWRPAKLGDTLAPPMRIRTGDGGAATLRATDGSTVKLLGATNVRVEALTRELARLSLGAGMVEADVRDDPGRLLELDLDDPTSTQPGKSRAAARTRGAAFVASSDGAGRASVATNRGEVVLSARGKEVTIHTGEYARVAPGETPTPPSAIPASLFLKVAWPGASSRQHKITIAGEAAPGTRIAVEGRFVKVAPDGRYQADLELPEGTHRIGLEATDLAGRKKTERSPPITIDSSTDFQAHPPKWGQ